MTDELVLSAELQRVYDLVTSFAPAAGVAEDVGCAPGVFGLEDAS